MKSLRQGEKPGSVEDLTVGGVKAVKEGGSELSGGKEAGPIVEKVGGSHWRV